MQDEFEDFMDLRAREVRGAWFDCKVAGVTMTNPDGTSRQMIARSLSPYDPLQLVPEPLNPYDKNAVQLVTGAGEVVGYLEARLAAEFTRRQSHCQYRAWVRAVRERGTICGVSFGLLHYRITTVGSQE